MNALNIIGPKVSWHRNRIGWSQDMLAAKLQILGMEKVSRAKVSKIEAQIIWVSDSDIYYLAEVLNVGLHDLFPEALSDPKVLANNMRELRKRRVFKK
ncbi:MAG: helix-turn-helix transcriptional regulator [Chthoniobacterales bacterium]|jgi:transcriptional regulator with XRE-family HTH domain|nr:helix-turn-helix domain-containing protein [Verrucomicrobiota bacterium]MCX8494222.1 helix-turn-helix transcriptional regulator [Chthoniobacterales bacterium]